MYEMVYSKYSKDIYKSVKLITGTVMRNPEMLKFVPDHPKTKKQRKHAVKLLPDKTQQMWDKAISENGGTLKSLLNS